MMDICFTFSSPIWLYSAESNWHFVTLPKEKAEEVKFFTSLTLHSKPRGFGPRGFGSVPVQLTSAHMEWKTSLFPDKKSGSYLLPLKAAVRKAENWSVGDIATLELRVLTDI